MTSRWPPLEDSGHLRRPEPLGPPSPDLTPTPPIQLGGIVAGKYRIDRVIGFGGMGIVCAAQHLELGTAIAVKFVRPERAADERATSRFLKEARAAAQLQSQYACRVMDCGQLPSGGPYIVMEYLTGEDLRTRVDQRGPLDVQEAVLLALQACEALAEAHAKHIVHRDVKPENLFLAEGPGGVPWLKVLDFGISKQLSPLLTQRSLTDSTESMGSPFHMSPEQMLDPSSVDSRTDIWSLGVVLYEALTGQMPFAGETGPQLCANVMTTEPIPPQAHRHDIPDELARVILGCLQKDKTKRYADVGELSQALREFGGPSAGLAAARVEQILGRPGELQTDSPPDLEHGNEAASAESRQVIDSIPGVPRRGLGLRVSVALVLVVATGLAAWGIKRAMTPVALEPLPAAVPSASVAPEPAPPAPSVVPSSSHVVGPPRKAKSPAARPDPTARPPRASSTPTPPLDQGRAPEPAESSSVVYPELPPIPEPALPEPE